MEDGFADPSFLCSWARCFYDVNIILEECWAGFQEDRVVRGESMGKMMAQRSPITADQINRQRAWVEIDPQALKYNLAQLGQLLSPGTKIMAVVKADAYGHGAVRMATWALEGGAQWLAIATLPEGIELREAGITAPILILGATNTPEEIRAIVQWQLQPTLCTLAQVTLFEHTLAELQTVLPVHGKIDTGMSRLGTPWPQALDFLEAIRRSPHLHLASIYSHFATADEPNRSTTHEQQSRFQRVIRQWQERGYPLPQLHMANSAATLLGDRRFHYDFVRIGLSLYGLYPAPHLQTISLKPVLQVKARITQVKRIAAGTGVSYGHRFIAPRDLTMAVVAIGYADGVPRGLSQKLQVLLRGKRLSQLGVITMDQLMIDVTAVPEAQVGDIVTLLGRDGEESIGADDWAEILGSISWEILCGFKHRLPRVVVSTGHGG